MVFPFEHVDLDSGPGGKWDVVPLPLTAAEAAMQKWQDGLADVGWNSLYWSNHDQPRAVSRFGSDDPRAPRPLREGARPRCCTCTAGRRTSTRARSSA